MSKQKSKSPKIKNPSASREGADQTRSASWRKGKGPIFKFVGLFVLLMAVFYVCTYIPIMNKTILPSYMRFNAQASAVILSVFGEGAKADDTYVSSARYSVNILHGCDAVEPTALFVAAVLAFPASLRSKLPGMLAGSIFLAIINLVRIVSLFYTGIYWPKAFNIMHEDVWQSLFILLSLVLWIAWALWATNVRVPQRANTS